MPYFFYLIRGIAIRLFVGVFVHPLVRVFVCSLTCFGADNLETP